MKKRFVSFFITAVILAGIFGLNHALFGGGNWRPVSLNPQKSMAKLQSDISPAYQTDRFQLFFLSDDQGLQPYAYVKRLGIWVQEYPQDLVVSPVCEAGGTAYYFGMPACLENASQAAMIGLDGTIIQGTPLSAEGQTRFLFEMPADKEECYRFSPVEDGSLREEKNDPFASGLLVVEQSLFSEEGDTYRVTEEIPLENLAQDFPSLAELLRQAWDSADQTSSIPDGRTYPGSDRTNSLSIHLTSPMDDYLKTGDGIFPYSYTRKIYYTFELEGYHAATVSRSEWDFRYKPLSSAMQGGDMMVYPFQVTQELTDLALQILEQYPDLEHSSL